MFTIFQIKHLIMKAIINKNWLVKLTIVTILFFNMFLFLACEEIINEAFDCILKVMPKLPDKQLTDGEIGYKYFDSIKASEINESNDDSWGYSFVITGNLPTGVEYEIDHRTIFISGQPTKKGVFRFKVNLTIGNGLIENDDGICFSDDSTEKTYSITIH